MCELSGHSSERTQETGTRQLDRAAHEPGLMTILSALFVQLTLLAPMNGDAQRASESVHHLRVGEAPVVSLGRVPEPFSILHSGILPQWQNQVRIEQRVVIHIAPSPPATREEILARLPRRPMETRYEEVAFDRCVPVQGIAGVAPVQQNRLLLFMRDRRVLSAALERACDAQAFYSGFYVERNEDGMLCTGRDKLQSRAGASCEVAQFNRLVAIRE